MNDRNTDSGVVISNARERFEYILNQVFAESLPPTEMEGLIDEVPDLISKIENFPMMDGIAFYGLDEHLQDCDTLGEKLRLMQVFCAGWLHADDRSREGNIHPGPQEALREHNRRKQKNVKLRAERARPVWLAKFADLKKVGLADDAVAHEFECSEKTISRWRIGFGWEKGHTNGVSGHTE